MKDEIVRNKIWIIYGSMNKVFIDFLFYLFIYFGCSGVSSSW